MATKVVTIASQKGGVGKSTLAVNLAAEATRRGHKAVIVELDRQGTASSWFEKREGQRPEVKQVADHQLAQAIAETNKAGAKLILIDLPGTQGPSVTWAIRAADLILIPSRAAEVDLEATIDTRRTIADEGKDCAYVFTFTPARGGAHKQIKDRLSAIGQTVAPVFITQLSVFHDALAAGQSVHEYEPDGQADALIADLWAWLSGQLKATQRRTAKG